MQSTGLITYMSTILHIVAQVLMVPVLIVLGILILFTLYSVGRIITEFFTEHRYFKVNGPKIINDIHNSTYEDLENVVEEVNLLNPQRSALITVIRNMGLNEDELFALARVQIDNVNDSYKRVLMFTEQVTKLAPMLGLMCTLIPLGPGIVAMGKGDVNQLSMSLLIAFDGTVAGLVAAVVAMIITAIRKRWYARYIVILESLMMAILSKAEVMKKKGAELPISSHNIMEESKKVIKKPKFKSKVVKKGSESI